MAEGKTPDFTSPLVLLLIGFQIHQNCDMDVPSCDLGHVQVLSGGINHRYMQLISTTIR
jgi:hypothetical protein